MPTSFFDRDARTVAPELLGKVLVCASERGDQGDVAVRLVEVEAYCGRDDPGSHAFRGETTRNATMFGPPGHLYVYRSYGIHWCANVVCGPGRTPHAVLLRAADPLAGEDLIWTRRPAARRRRDLCSGPGKLAQALGIVGSDDGSSLHGPRVRLVDDGVTPPDQVGVSPRIGLGTGKGEHEPWRFFVPDDPNLSRRVVAPARSRD